ncbi:MAG TPA: protoporphyrinogen oxidase [Burkholderiales bacterium]|jgi:oxygen-dependent protoporphyrinogen oxidase
MTDTLIVGGGITGLATAWFLRRRGIAATVLEGSGEPGGTVRTAIRAGFTVDTGPTSTLSRGGALEELIAGVELRDDVVEADRRAPRYIVKGDRLIPLPATLSDFLSTPLFTTRAKLRLLAEPFRRRAREEESIAQFTRRRIGPQFLDWAVDPFVSGVYAGDPERLSVRAAVPRLYALEARYGSLFVGALAGLFRGESGGAQPRGRLISFRRGMQTLPNAIARALGPSLRLNTTVGAIARSGAQWIARAPHAEYRAANLILAVPAHRAAELLAPIDAAVARELSAIAYPPVASIALGFARKQIGHTLDGFGALLPRRLQRETLGVIFASTLFAGRAPPDRVLLTAFIGGSRNPSAGDLDEPELVQRVLSDLRQLLAIDGAPMFQNVTRWRHAIPQYELGHDARIDRIDDALTKHPGLHLRGNWRGGVSLADCVSSADGLARTVKNT